MTIVIDGHSYSSLEFKSDNEEDAAPDGTAATDEWQTTRSGCTSRMYALTLPVPYRNRRGMQQ
jgi:hypothetical protein